MSNRLTLFADVILPVPIHRAFTYRIPFEMNDQVAVGLRVIVPFGKNKLHTAIVVNVHESVPKEYQSKYIEDNSNKILNYVEVDNVCEECEKIDENVKSNLIMSGYKICNSCKTSKTIFPI